MRLGIDFGTTRTVVAAVLDGRYPVARFRTATGYADHVPGIAATDADGILRYGWEAAPLLHDRPRRAIRSLKRVAGAGLPDDPIPGLPMDAMELATGFLRYLREAIVTTSNLKVGKREPIEAMVAVPANASSAQRYLTLRAFEDAGFRVVGMVNEPTAAAIEYGQQNLTALGPRSPKRYVLVYDLGGGTFDAASVSLEGHRFELLDSEGVASLGGHDFDAILLELALAQAGVARATLSPTEEAMALEACREAKEAIRSNSRRVLVELADAIPDLREPVIVAADAYFTACAPLIARTIETVDDLFVPLASHGIDPDDARQLGALYVVGGGAAFAPVTKALRAHYKRKVELSPDPHAATAVGLAIAADDAAGVYVREASTRHFGVWREGADGREKVFDPILRRGTLPEDGEPIVVRRTYHPEHPIGHLRFMECARLDERGEPKGDVTPWDEVVFPYDPTLAERARLDDVPIVRNPDLSGETIDETYTYKPDGCIEVAIENRTHGYRRTYVIDARR